MPEVRRRPLSVMIRDLWGHPDLPNVGDPVVVDLGYGQRVTGRCIGVYNRDAIRVALPDEPLPEVAE